MVVRKRLIIRPVSYTHLAYKYLVEMAEKNMIEYDGQEIRTNVTRKYSGEQTQTPIVGSIPCEMCIRDRLRCFGISFLLFFKRVVLGVCKK